MIIWLCNCNSNFSQLEVNVEEYIMVKCDHSPGVKLFPTNDLNVWLMGKVTKNPAVLSISSESKTLYNPVYTYKLTCK